MRALARAASCRAQLLTRLVHWYPAPQFRLRHMSYTAHSMATYCPPCSRKVVGQHVELISLCSTKGFPNSPPTDPNKHKHEPASQEATKRQIEAKRDAALKKKAKKDELPDDRSSAGASSTRAPRVPLPP